MNNTDNTKPINGNELYNKIASLLEEARRKVVSAVNIAMVYTYFEIGRIIVEDEQNGNSRAEYGKEVLKNLSERLTEKFGKGFSVTNLKQMRDFYQSYSIRQTLSDQFHLSWSHYLFLMRIDNKAERDFYEKEASNSNWSLRELKRQFDSSLYERLTLSKDKDEVMKLSAQGIIIEKPADIVKDPYILQCFVLIDLKIGELSHQDLGQMQMYVNYYDRFVKLEHENKTIGIVLCKKKNDALVEITLPEENRQIFASKYQTVLPDKQSLTNLILDK